MKQEYKPGVPPEQDRITLPASVAGSGALDRLLETARDYARAAASDKIGRAHV